MDLGLLNAVLKMKEKELFYYLKGLVNKMYGEDNVQFELSKSFNNKKKKKSKKKFYKLYGTADNNGFIYAKGDIPIMLVAHIDTVHSPKPDVIFHDRVQNVLWSPEGLGADDRAGVFIILSLLKYGFRPHVLFTDGEESGGLGASNACYKLSPPEVNYIIQLDRRGSNDSVYYNCDNSYFKDYIDSFGFSEAFGSFSDISTLCLEWGVAGVNLSVGYVNEHTSSEHLYINDMENTYERVKKMLKEPFKEKFIYYEKPSIYMRNYNYEDAYRNFYEQQDFPQAIDITLDEKTYHGFFIELSVDFSDEYAYEALYEFFDDEYKHSNFISLSFDEVYDDDLIKKKLKESLTI